VAGGILERHDDFAVNNDVTSNEIVGQHSHDVGPIAFRCGHGSNTRQVERCLGFLKSRRYCLTSFSVSRREGEGKRLLIRAASEASSRFFTTFESRSTSSGRLPMT
jgi:hypothetical protein